MAGITRPSPCISRARTPCRASHPVQPTRLVMNESATQSITGTAIDRAGNSVQGQVTVNVDMTPPALTITSPSNGDVVSSDSVTVTGTVSDTLSGLAAVTCNGQPVAILLNNTFSQGALA